MFWGGALLGRELGARLVLDRDLKVDELLGERGHVVAEAEAILADLVGGEDKVALSLLDTIEDDLVVRSGHLVVNIERTSGLHLSMTLGHGVEAAKGGGMEGGCTAK